MEIESKCSNCGQRLAIKTAETVSAHVEKMFKRAMDKFTISVLCGKCEEWTMLDDKEEEE